MTDLPRNTLFVYNVLSAISGIVLLWVGATIHGVYGSYSQFLDNTGYMSTSVSLLIIGMIIFILSYIGYCAAVKNNSCMISTYRALLILVIICELEVGISNYVLRNNTKEILTQNINVTIWNYKNYESQKSIDVLQQSFHCCGLEGPKDWYGYDMLPLSCCNLVGIIGNFTCNNASLTQQNITRLYTEGCVEGFGDFIAPYADVSVVAAFGSAVVQLLGITFSCYFLKQNKEYQKI